MLFTGLITKKKKNKEKERHPLDVNKSKNKKYIIKPPKKFKPKGSSSQARGGGGVTPLSRPACCW